MSGEEPDYPEPLCTTCEDSGAYPIFHASTDAVIGHRICTDPKCVARREQWTREWQERDARERAERLADTEADECPF